MCARPIKPLLQQSAPEGVGLTRRDKKAAMNTNDLRPKFFRYAGGRAYSGWRSPNGDIWATHDTRNQVVEELKERNANLRSVAVELALTIPDEHGLCLMNRAEPALRTGEVLEFTEPVDLSPMASIEAGERCVSVRRDKTSGVIELFMQGYYVGLERYSNCISIEPHCSDDVVPALRLVAA